MAPSIEATRVAVSRRAAILFCSISSAASRWMVRIVDTPKPTMSTTTIRSPIFSASGERNTAVASAARGLGDGLRQLVGLARIERQQARVHRTRVVETAHLDVRVTQVLERLRIVRPQPERLEIRLHRLVPVALLAQRVAEPVPGLGQLGIELDRLAVLALRGRPVAALGERASLVEARLGTDGAPVGHAQRRVVDGVRHRRHRQPREPEHRPAHRGDGSIWRVNLARLGEESVERFGEYTALHFEGRDLTNVEQQRTAARVARALARMGVSPGDRVVVLLHVGEVDRKSTRLNSSHRCISYAVFCLKKKKIVVGTTRSSNWVTDGRTSNWSPRLGRLPRPRTLSWRSSLVLPFPLLSKPLF